MALPTRTRLLWTAASALVLGTFLYFRVVDVLDGLHGKNLPSKDPRDQTEVARYDLEMFRRALVLYRQRNGSYPSPIDGLRAMVPEFLPEIPLDPWGHLYRYRLTPGQCEVGSPGKNKQTGDALDPNLTVHLPLN